MMITLALAGCKDSKERAEDHYQSGLSLISEGQVDKGLVELRNVFNLNGDHREARALYASTVRERGDLRDAFGQYLRLVEQFPDDIEGRIALSEMAFNGSNWDEFERHSKVVIAANLEDDIRAKVIEAAAVYRDAVIAEDEPARLAAAQTISDLAEAGANSNILRRIIIESLLRSQKFSAALTEIEKSLQDSPDDIGLYQQKLAVLGQLRDNPGIETTLREMIKRFPNEENLGPTLVRFYLSQDDLDSAEAYLRERIDPQEESQEGFVTLIRFLLERRSSDAALAELETALAKTPDDLVLRSLRAGIDFDNGRSDKAIADLEQLITLEGQDPERINAIKVTLARMQLSQQNEVGARRLVEEVLAADSAQVEALKMRAAWQIEADDADSAITSLRAALDRSPQDAQAMGMMAQAYTRTGRHELARDYLSLAVEASGNAPAQSLRYAALLRREERYLPAEDTLLASLRANPNNVSVLGELGELYVLMKDIARARQVVDTLRRIDTDISKNAANALDVQILSEREGTESAVNFLEDLADQSGDVGPKIAIIQARLNEGKPQEALEYATEVLADNPDSPIVKYAFHVSQAYSGQPELAEAGYREMLAADPTRERVWIELIRLLGSQGRRDDIDLVINEGLAAVPDAPNLLWAAATFLERDGNLEGAIKVYEQLYEASADSIIVANNLASLLTISRPDDAEAVERAYNVGRRLRGSEVPAFQDTYGWIMYLRGDFEAAVRNLEPAAEALTNDPLVQYHLAKTYKALQRSDEALERFKRAVEIAGEIDTRPQIEEARGEIRNQ